MDHSEEIQSLDAEKGTALPPGRLLAEKPHFTDDGLEAIALNALSRGTFGEALHGLNRIQLLALELKYLCLDAWLYQFIEHIDVDRHPTIVALKAELKHAQTTIL